MRALDMLGVAASLVAALALPAGAAPWEKSGIDWSKPPTAAPDRAFKPPQSVRMKLKNGLNVLVIENHRLPLVAMRLVVLGAGSTQDPAGKGGLAAFTADLLDEGAAGMSALEIDDRQNELGASIEIDATKDAGSITVATLARTLDPTLELVVKILTAPSFDELEVERVHADRVTDLELLPDRPRQVAAQLLNGMLYGLHAAYGRPTDGTLDEVKALTLADARAFYADHWTPSQMTLVVAGDVDTKALKARLDELLGSWKPKGKKPVKAPSVAGKPSARIFLVDRPGSEQADVRIGVVAIDQKDRGLPAVTVLSNILGGSFTSRLNHRLREELGWTYDIRAGLSPILGKSPFVISTALVTPHAVEGIAEILKIVDSTLTADIPEAEFQKGKLNLTRRLPQQLATNGPTRDDPSGGIANAYASLVIRGLPDSWWYSYVKDIHKTTAKDVRTVAKALLAKKGFIIVVVGDASALKTGLEGLGLGPVQMVTTEGTPAE